MTYPTNNPPKEPGSKYVERHTGYVMVLVPGHAKGIGRGWVREHVLVAERALGKPLPKGAVVHHVNEVKSENRGGNLCILQNDEEHANLHHRMRVRDAGGNPFTDRVCIVCEAVKPAAEFSVVRSRRFMSSCKSCNREKAKREYWAKRGVS